jgi:hypothetical protein
MVTDEVWHAARMPPRGHLCIPCLERRLARALTGEDLTDDEINRPNPGTDSPRMLELKQAGPLGHHQGT